MNQVLLKFTKSEFNDYYEIFSKYITLILHNKYTSLPSDRQQMIHIFTSTILSAKHCDLCICVASSLLDLAQKHNISDSNIEAYYKELANEITKTIFLVLPKNVMQKMSYCIDDRKINMVAQPLSDKFYKSKDEINIDSLFHMYFLSLLSVSYFTSKEKKIIQKIVEEIEKIVEEETEEIEVQ